MMRPSAKSPAKARTMKESSPSTGDEWEVRPCGMLVQKRNPHFESASAPVPTIRVRVKYGSACHEIYISSQATFGELKKLLAGPTGLHPLDQKILFKDKERESKAYLDTSGVKDRSKLVVVEDLMAQAKRCLEMRRAAKMDKASKTLAHVTHQVDKLASKVAALEAIVLKRKKVADGDLLNLIEMLMNELLKLDGIVADGDVKVQRGMQVKRVQRYIETDMLKIKNSSSSNGDVTKEKKPTQAAAVVSTTKWETFDSLISPSTSAAAASKPTPRFDWELF